MLDLPQDNVKNGKTKTVVISKKAIKRAESRNSELTTDQYLGVILARIHEGDARRSQKEGYFGVVDRANKERAEALSDMIYSFLSSLYGDKIPGDVFRQKCLERGMRADEIFFAEMKYKKFLGN